MAIETFNTRQLEHLDIYEIVSIYKREFVAAHGDRKRLHTTHEEATRNLPSFGHCTWPSRVPPYLIYIFCMYNLLE
jgi:hypothetical protein